MVISSLSAGLTCSHGICRDACKYTAAAAFRNQQVSIAGGLLRQQVYFLQPRNLTTLTYAENRAARKQGRENARPSSVFPCTRCTWVRSLAVMNIQK